MSLLAVRLVKACGFSSLSVLELDTLGMEADSNEAMLGHGIGMTIQMKSCLRGYGTTVKSVLKCHNPTEANAGQDKTFSALWIVC